MVFPLGRVVFRRLFTKGFPGGSRAYSTHHYPSSDRVGWLVRSTIGGTGFFAFFNWIDLNGTRKALADEKSRNSERPLVNTRANEEIVLDHRADEGTSMRSWN